MKPLHVATLEDLKAVVNGFKLYKKEGKFTYVRQDYLKREIEAKHVYFDNNTIAIIRQMSRKGKIGDYRYISGSWQMYQILSADKTKPLGPLIFMKRFLKEYVKKGILFGTVHDENVHSVKWHEALGFKAVGKVAWSGGTIKGTVYAHDTDTDMDSFAR